MKSSATIVADLLREQIERIAAIPAVSSIDPNYGFEVELAV
jgi:hypothetical protein